MLCNRSFSKKILNESGQSLIFAAFTIVSISLMALLASSYFGASFSNIDSFVDQKKSFYVSEGMLNLATNEVETFLQNLSPAQVTSGNLTTLLKTSNFTSHLPPGYSMPSAQASPNPKVTVQGPTQIGYLPTGAFRGMQSPLTPINVQLDVLKPNSAVNTNLNVSMTFGEIFPFQFIFFADFPYADWYPGPDMKLNGRVHVNGDGCLGGNGVMEVAIMTASKRIMQGNDSRCAYQTSNGNANLSFATDTTFLNFVAMDTTNDSLCTNCAGTGSPWASYDLTTWNGNVQDEGNQVPILTFPGEADPGNNAQMGINMMPNGTWINQSNQGNMRFTVDPPFNGDSPLITSEKFSNRADIRIVDGVWYLRNPASLTSWPGLPIWSDHPGNFTDPYGNRVGQDDLRIAWNTNGKGLPWGVNTPHMYSYYVYAKAAQNIGNSGYGVVSYGSLGANPTLPLNPPSPLVPMGWNGNSFSNTGPFSNMTLNATRSGFVNPHIYYQAQTNGDPYDKVLPINFDVGAFQKALTTTTPGELGSYFGATNFMGHNFNGIIYVTATWPGSTTGYGGPTPPLPYPFQGNVLDPFQTSALSTAGQQALPFQLCSLAPVAGKFFDAPTNKFKVPNCRLYGLSPKISAYTNAVRVINGVNLDPAILKSGISIVTNLPFSIAGDYNKNSNVSSATSLPWVSSLVAGDMFVIMSNSWSDLNSRWDVPVPNNILATRSASDTTINTALQVAFYRAPRGNQFHAIPAQMEDWINKTLTISGSIVVGYYPVFQQATMSPPTNLNTYQPGYRYFTFDQHFSLPSNQPPGAIAYPVSAVSKWTGN